MKDGHLLSLLCTNCRVTSLSQRTEFWLTDQIREEPYPLVTKVVSPTTARMFLISFSLSVNGIGQR